MGFLIFIAVVVLATLTAFLVWRGRLIRKMKKEMDEMAAYAVEYKQKLLDEGILEEYGSRSVEELQNELSNLEYRINNLRYPEDKEAMLEADQKRSIIQEILGKRHTVD